MADDLWTIQRLLLWTVPFFQKHGLESPRLDAELLLSHVLKRARIYLYTDYEKMLSREELAAYKALIQKRIQGWSVASLIGEKEFMGLNFTVNDHVLIPRPDTEAWLEKVIQRCRGEGPLTVADLGTGSGAIIVSFLHYCPQAKGVAVDISPEALEVARKNGEILGVSDRVEWREGDFLAPLKEGELFDIILTNPPYIPTADMEGLAPEVKREPRLALDGGGDGLSFYRRFAEGGVAHVKPGGLSVLEVGEGEAQAVTSLLAASGEYESFDVIQDLGGIDRAVLARKK